MLQDYSLDEGLNQSYSFTHEPLRYYPPLDDEVTVGISVIAEHGDIVVMGTDMRATYPGLAPHDECAKAWLTDKPIQCGVAVAGTLRIAQPFIDFLSFYFERAGKKKPIYREHIENAIGLARYRT